MEGKAIKVPCDLSLIDKVKKSFKREINSKLIVINVEKKSEKKYIVNLYHPNSGLLLVSDVDFFNQEPRVVDVKVQSI